MMYFLYGEDTAKARAKASELLQALQKKKPDAALFKVTEEDFSEGALEEYLGGQGLFSQKYLVFFDRVFTNKGAKEVITRRLKDIAVSDNVMIFLEGKLDSASRTKIEKHAEKLQSFELKETAKFAVGDFNIFSLTDALARRDKKGLWLLYLETVKRGIAPEEVSGILFWKVKDMMVKQNSRAFSVDELKKLSSSLVSTYHDSHRGLSDFEIALEKWVLSI